MVTHTDLQEFSVDLIDDLQMPGQQPLYEVYWPAFQGLGQHSVVGVGTGPHNNIPGLVERDIFIIYKSLTRGS